MITKLTLKNFKSIDEQSYEFGKFDLLVGRNNSGKSTILQALAIWQYCVDEFHRSKRVGSRGIQVILPNFTALPLPEFNLLWKNRTDRHWPTIDGKKKQQYILIEIILEWHVTTHSLVAATKLHTFGIQLRYHTPQTLYAIPSNGWQSFREYENKLPTIAYVPPFSGLEPIEEWRDDGLLRKQVGKAQPGSVLRNLLLRVCPPPQRDLKGRISKGYQLPAEWNEIKEVVERWFSVKLLEPKYEQGKDVQIVLEYEQDKKKFDIIAGGSGFHQTLTLLAFLYGYQPTTILLDEPDAHLHVNLQREILDYFKQKSSERNIQFLIATHAEEFVNGVDAAQIISLLAQVPRRVQSQPEVIRAMADVSNAEITGMMSLPFMLYVEGETDERILRAWASAGGMEDILAKLCFKTMQGGSKDSMKAAAEQHFNALRLIIPEARRLMLFDFDDAKNAFHPLPDNPVLYEWKRKNIENYLLVPAAWKRAVLGQFGIAEDDLFSKPLLKAIEQFFINQNLTLPPGKSWRNVTANIFEVVDGKRILFEDDNSLFHTLGQGNPAVKIIRENVAVNMLPEEIHEDVHQFFAKLGELLNST